jgi:hypothetical protein
MVVKSPSIIIDGKTILDHGRMHFVESEWRENYEKISLEGSPVRKAVNVSRSGTEADFYGKRLQRILRPEPGRVSTCFVGDDDTSRLAYALYANIPPDDKEISIGSLARKSKIDEESTRRILHVMQDYSLIRLH